MSYAAASVTDISSFSTCPGSHRWPLTLRVPLTLGLGLGTQSAGVRWSLRVHARKTPCKIDYATAMVSLVTRLPWFVPKRRCWHRLGWHPNHRVRAISSHWVARWRLGPRECLIWRSWHQLCWKTSEWHLTSPQGSLPPRGALTDKQKTNCRAQSA